MQSSAFTMLVSPGTTDRRSLPDHAAHGRMRATVRLAVGTLSCSAHGASGLVTYVTPLEARLGQVEVVRTLEEHTYGSLREAISTGAVRPGYRLSADQLAKDLGVSRMPVVQALRRLASEGFVTAEPDIRR